MLSYIIRRIIYMILLLVVLSFVSFVLIELPPGDAIATMVNQWRQSGRSVAMDDIRELEARYGLDKPFHVRYLRWASNLLRGNMGQSIIYGQPVARLIGERFTLTVCLTFATMILTFMIAIPIGIYSATHQYSFEDYAATTFGFIGQATPNFLLALLLLFLIYRFTNWSVGGLFTARYAFEPWSFAKLVDLLKHLPVPLIVIGTAGTAGLIRTLRATLLDELPRQYVVTARAKGVGERELLFKYPVRIALNPIVSGIGGILPALVSGETITAIVLSLPTIGPLLLEALLGQDMFLAGSMVMVLSALGLSGALIADFLLVVVDPRIRFEAKATD